jgi:hypothetical protein
MYLMMVMFDVFDCHPHGLFQSHPDGELFRDLNFRLGSDIVFCRDAEGAVKNVSLQLRVERGQRVELAPQLLGVATGHIAVNDFSSRFPFRLIGRWRPFRLSGFGVGASLPPLRPGMIPLMVITTVERLVQFLCSLFLPLAR